MPARCLAVLLVLVLSGCSGGGLETVPVSGKVTLDGKPVSGAGVLFMPVAEGPPAAATTDEQGQFLLQTAGQPGAAPGNYRVSISLQKTSGVTVNEEGLEGSAGAGGVKVEWIVPEKYSNPDTSGLTADVAADMQPLVFALESK